MSVSKTLPMGVVGRARIRVELGRMVTETTRFVTLVARDRTLIVPVNTVDLDDDLLKVHVKSVERGEALIQLRAAGDGQEIVAVVSVDALLADDVPGCRRLLAWGAAGVLVAGSLLLWGQR